MPGTSSLPFAGPRGLSRKRSAIKKIYYRESYQKTSSPEVQEILQAAYSVIGYGSSSQEHEFVARRLAQGVVSNGARVLLASPDVQIVFEILHI
jgi:hypothetical protein